MFVIRRHFTTKWLKILKLSKICLKKIIAMTSKTTDQNICFLNRWIRFNQHYRFNESGINLQMSRIVTKPTNWQVRPAKSQISLGIRPVWSESLLWAKWIAKDPSFLQADSKDSDQTGWMPRLIWVFAGRTDHFIGSVTMRLKSLLITTSEKILWVHNPSWPSTRLDWGCIYRIQ